MQGMFLLSKRLTPSTGYGQPSAGVHPSPAGGWQVPPDAAPEAGLALQTQPWQGWKQNPFGLAVQGENLFFFFGCAVETQQVPSVLCKVSPPDRELLVSVSGQQFQCKAWAPGLHVRGCKQEVLILIWAVTNFMRNSGSKVWEQASRNFQGRSEEMTRRRWKSRGKKKKMCKGKMR